MRSTVGIAPRHRPNLFLLEYILICAPPFRVNPFRHGGFPSLEKVWGYLGIHYN